MIGYWLNRLPLICHDFASIFRVISPLQPVVVDQIDIDENDFVNFSHRYSSIIEMILYVM